MYDEKTIADAISWSTLERGGNGHGNGGGDGGDDDDGYDNDSYS